MSWLVSPRRGWPCAEPAGRSHLAVVALGGTLPGRRQSGQVIELCSSRHWRCKQQEIPGKRWRLSECLTLAEPEGYVRTFLDEGPPMQRLLAKALAQVGAGRCGTTPAACSPSSMPNPMGLWQRRKKIPAADRLSKLRQALVAPLSQRELEVLRLIALGRTNQEIARSSS